MRQNSGNLEKMQKAVNAILPHFLSSAVTLCPNIVQKVKTVGVRSRKTHSHINMGKACQLLKWKSVSLFSMT